MHQSINQVKYGVNIVNARVIGFVLVIIIVTVFCVIFLDGPMLVYLKLNATSMRLRLFYAKPNFRLFNVAQDLLTV